MIILGIDPGVASLGYGVVDYRNDTYRVLESGCLKTKSDQSLVRRIMDLCETLEEVIKQYKVTDMSVEDIFFAKNVSSAMKVAKVYGAIMMLAAQHKLNFYEYTPLQIKQAVATYGRADKMQVQRMVAMILGLPDVPKNNHAADALAAVVCHTNQAKFTLQAQ